MHRKFVKFIPAIIWMILIFIVSSQPDMPSNKVFLVDFFFKKSAHFIEYAILFILWYRALGKKMPTEAIMISISYAFTDEIHQLFVPGRTGLLRDVAIDSIGIIIFSFLIVKFDLWKLLISQHPLKKQEK